MNILADASLPGLTQAFADPFNLTLYHDFDELPTMLAGQDILLCRANLTVDKALLANHPLRYVATASSGTDHLDKAWLDSQNIQIIDAKGCNASAVADYVVSCLAYLTQHHFIRGNKAGIIGLGKVGTQVQARLEAAGFETLAYDPLKATRENSNFESCSLDELHYVDLLCVHAELHDNPAFPSANLINEQFIAQLNPGCVIINGSRGGIVNEAALLNTEDKFIYCTDVYLNEPAIDKRMIDKAMLCTPHIAGHSIEAKYLAVSMVSNKLHEIAGLPKPKINVPKVSTHLSLETHKSWQENILSLYNPLYETQLLKESNSVTKTFIKARKEHQKRHDFKIYSNSHLNEQLKLLLGNSTS